MGWRPASTRSNLRWNGNKLCSLFFSAEHVELCLFGGPCDRSLDEQRIDLHEVDGHVWHAYLPDVTPGQHYGYRVHGEWNPDAGLWHNDNKVLLDPYARALMANSTGIPRFAYDLDDPDSANSENSAPFVPLGVVHDRSFDWGGDELLKTPTHESIIYEAHVRGFTMQHPTSLQSNGAPTPPCVILRSLNISYSSELRDRTDAYPSVHS